jgi:hypothetical protein
MTENLTERDILALPMKTNDAGAETIGQFIMMVGAKVFLHQDGFSGKRPFGNSGWVYDVYEVLITSGVLEGTLDEDGYVEDCDSREAEAVVARLFDYLKALDFSKLPEDIPIIHELHSPHYLRNNDDESNC